MNRSPTIDEYAEVRRLVLDELRRQSPDQRTIAVVGQALHWYKEKILALCDPFRESSHEPVVMAHMILETLPEEGFPWIAVPSLDDMRKNARPGAPLTC